MRWQNHSEIFGNEIVLHYPEDLRPFVSKHNGYQIAYWPGNGRGQSNLVRCLETGAARIIKWMGKPISGESKIFVVDRIDDLRFRKHRELEGLCQGSSTYRGKINLAFVRKSVSVGLCAHELLHAWFDRNQRMRPKYWWWEEGLAHCIESPSGFSRTQWDALKFIGPASSQELYRAKEGQDNEDLVRATAWLMVFFFYHYCKAPFSEISLLCEALPNTERVFSFVKRFRFEMAKYNSNYLEEQIEEVWEQGF